MFVIKSKEELAKITIFVNLYRGQKKTPESRYGVGLRGKPAWTALWRFGGLTKEASHAGHKRHNAFTLNESIRESLIFEVKIPYFQLRDWMRDIRCD